jgi:hypothetical protein
LEQIFRLNLFAPVLLESQLLDLIEENGVDRSRFNPQTLQTC